MLPPKPDKTFQFRTDFRKLNTMTYSDSYPLPRMDGLTDRLGACQYVTKIDVLKGFYQMRLLEGAREVSSSVTPDGF